MMYQAWRRPGICFGARGLVDMAGAEGREREKEVKRTYVAKDEEEDVEERVSGTDAAFYPDWRELVWSRPCRCTGVRESGEMDTWEGREEDGEHAEEDVGGAHCDCCAWGIEGVDLFLIMLREFGGRGGGA